MMMLSWRRMAFALASAPLAVAAATADTDSVHDKDMRQRMIACTVCHGDQGRASSAGYLPRIAGKSDGYLFNQLVNFREGRRSNSQMAGLVEHLGDEPLREIAAWFASLEVPYAPSQPDIASAEKLARGEQLVRDGDLQRRLPACTACHGERMTGVLPAMPGLLGLPRDYLLGQLGAWRNGARRAVEPDCMAEVAKGLSGQDIEAVTSWLSAQAPLPDMRPVARAATPLPIECGSGER